MIITKSIKFSRILRWTWHHITYLLLGAALIAYLYRIGVITITIPWLPISVIGTAVAFYISFKNNSAYDRLWEARKIWGAIVNSSRAWGSYVDGFVTEQFHPNGQDLAMIKQRLIYRHIAWLYALRSQLLVATSWEHSSQKGATGKVGRMYQKKFGIGLVDDEVTRVELKDLLPPQEHDRLVGHVNTATQIINEQARDLRKLRADNLIDDFRHMEMMQVLYHFYEHQGKCERIKKFPLPRQYANISNVFIWIFLLLLPFSMIPELMHTGDLGFFLSVPLTALIGWVYISMELIGDYSENPFSGMGNDIPMLSLCRTIEIDLREMLGETDLPPAIQAKNGILM
ncbi:bestrophin family ion channel [Flagellimonas sp. DF-77]|uniref:bestrophin family protein n=1 Tax=Flagellimonas algarum TaxID=3230298 RepID=UPI0033941E73